MGVFKQQLVLSFTMNEDNEVDITYQLNPKTEDVPQSGPEYDLHILAVTCCDAAYKAMKETFR